MVMAPARSKAGPPVGTSPAGDRPTLRQVPAVTRAAAVLRLLGRSSEPMGVNAIARALDLFPSTCLHILRALAAEELVSFDAASKRYALDAGILSIARAMLRQERLGRTIQSALDRLAERHGVTAIGVRAIGLSHMIVVAISRSPAALHLHTDVGSRFPALISATGRCLAAFGGHPPAAIRSRFHALRWDNAPDLATWLAEVEETGRRGYAVDQGRYIRGVTILAAPVFDAQRRMTHSIVALGVHEQVVAAGLDTLAEAVRKVAADASEPAD
jgi:DNA-binding IclR family transcriptional regulator